VPLKQLCWWWVPFQVCYWNWNFVVSLNCESTCNIMSDVHHTCVYCYYNSCSGNTAKWFSTLQDNDYRTVCVCYTITMVILLRDSRPYDLHYWKFIVSFRGSSSTCHLLRFEQNLKYITGYLNAR
jgi:hypothetical protein